MVRAREAPELQRTVLLCFRSSLAAFTKEFSMTSPTSAAASHSIFDHTLRKEWGVGILAWEDGGKRGYLFEDGEERTLASGFHQLMRKVEKPSAEQVAAFEHLRVKLAAREQTQAAGGAGSKFRDQLVTLHATYGAGLLDPKWVADI